MSDIVTVSLRAHGDGRGELVALQPGDGALPFEIRRVYYIYAVPPGQVRGKHAHRTLQQLMVALHGRLDVILDDGRTQRRVTLSDPGVGLLVPAMTWREMHDFAPGTVCLVLASERFDESDYIRDYDTFLREVARVGGAAAGPVQLVPYDRDFLEDSWRWLGDEELRALTMTPSFTREAQAAWFAGLATRTDYLVWGVTAGGVRVGACGIKNIAAGAGEYWGYIGDKRYWGCGIGAEMVTGIVEHARTLGLSRLDLRVWQGNTRAIRLYQKHGFALSGTVGDVLHMERVL